MSGLKQHTIPQLVADHILRNRRHFHQLNDRAKATQAQRAAAGDASVLSYGFVTNPLQLDRELRFWEIEDDEVLDNFLNDDLLAALYGELGDEDWPRLPAGYRPLLLVLEFERHCQFEGWTAIDNRSDEMAEIIHSYIQLGLRQEATALQAVFDAFRKSANPHSDAIDEELGKAYRSVPNATPEIEDRIPLILAYVRQHPQQFADRDGATLSSPWPPELPAPESQSMPNNEPASAPDLRFWTVGIVGLLWNAIGILTFWMTVTMSQATLDAMPAAERALHENTPAWVTLAYALAVFGGTLGSLLLLLRRAMAVPVFVLSLVGIVAQMGHALLLTEMVAVLGAGSAILPLLIMAIAAWLLWYALMAKNRGWLH